MPNLEIVLDRNDYESIQLFENIDGVKILKAEPSHFEGEINIIVLLITFAASITPSIASVLRERIKEKANIKIKYNGYEVSGAELDQLVEVIERLNSYED